MPMQLMQNRFYSFVEDVARIWAEFWVTMYGTRSLKIEDDKGDWYIPFDGNKFKNTIINARVDVGPASLWSEIQAQQTLDNLFAAQLLDPLQYLERLPKGSVPDQTGLVRELKDRKAAAEQPAAPTNPPAPAPEAAPPVPAPHEMPAPEGMPDPAALVQMLSPEAREKFMALTNEQKQAVIAQMMQNVNGG